MEHQTWRSCQVRPELFSTHDHHPSVPNLKKMATEGGRGGEEQNSTERKSLNAIAAKCSISDQQSQLRSVVKGY
jgi:hypothetical protein